MVYICTLDFYFIFQFLHTSFQYHLCISVTALGATLSLCGAIASKNDQPQALNYGKQSDPFDVLAKHCTSEVCNKKNLWKSHYIGYLGVLQCIQCQVLIHRRTSRYWPNSWHPES